MPIKARFVVAGLLLCAMATPTPAQTLNCTGIANEQARRECQMHRRRGYGEGLERALLESGVDANVYVEEAGDPGSGAYPRLVIWTHLTNGRAYELNSKAKILEEARKAGFRMIIYVDKGEDSNWYFDLTRPGQVALDVVPWQTPPWKH